MEAQIGRKQWKIEKNGREDGFKGIKKKKVKN